MPDDDSGSAPHLHLVPELDEATRKRLEEEARQADRRREQVFAEQDLRIAVRELAANVLRIVRGAGKPWALAQDCANVLSTVDAYKDAFSTWPPADIIGDLMQFSVERRGSEDRIECEMAIEQMIRGALQFVASSKLHQIPQTRVAERELLDGARRYADYEKRADAASEAKWQSARKAKAPARKGKRRKKIEL